jgi:hypothetical protein
MTALALGPGSGPLIWGSDVLRSGPGTAGIFIGGLGLLRADRTVKDRVAGCAYVDDSTEAAVSDRTLAQDTESLVDADASID